MLQLATVLLLLLPLLLLPLLARAAGQLLNGLNAVECTCGLLLYKSWPAWEQVWWIIVFQHNSSMQWLLWSGDGVLRVNMFGELW